MTDVDTAQAVLGRRTTRPRWVTDGGLETDLIYHHGVDLPGFAAYPLLDSLEGRTLLSRYYTGFAHVASKAGAGLLLETPTWRASAGWVEALGGSRRDVRRINLESVIFLAGLAEILVSDGVSPGGAAGYDGSGHGPDVRVCGVLGPRGDGYVAGEPTSADEFGDYHWAQIAAFAQSGAARVTAYTLTTVAEAVGVVQAARAQGVAVAVSFTVETNGRLPDGTPLGEAIELLRLQAAPDDLLVNCAHPTHIAAALTPDDGWTEHVTGLRVNASRRSHAELDDAAELDEGDIGDLVSEHEKLAARLPRLDIVGGCCGTDVRHVAALWGVEA
ncbi:homocysteine S-methyltransferase family protein [Knoellia sp. CPCC 206453]|uniref:homocysteine S-methyltransferase family protein n=1 Tax=Knoellia pratensis TaxID=3404796 RepID=UPI003618E9A3